MAVKTDLEIHDIRHFTARQLRPILEFEARRWQQRLRWDYVAAVELLLQYLDSRMLPGFVALDQGTICGFTFCVYEGSKAVVGDAFAIDNSIMSALATTHELLKQLLHLLNYSPDVDRIEAQLLLYDSGRIAVPFDEARFDTYPRLFMQLDLRDLSAASASFRSTSALSNTFRLHPWTPADYNPAAELIHRSYHGHIDATINDQYRSLAGSLRFLHNIVRFPGCGIFDARSSWTLRDRRTGGLAGIVLCSRVQHDTAHVTQLCIGHPWRGQNLGAMLLHHALEQLARNGFGAVTLTVTEANRSAVELYLRLRFAVVHRFDAHVYNKSA